MQAADTTRAALHVPSPTISTPARCLAYLEGHDCMHVILGRGLLNQDEAFVIGFTMGSARKITEQHATEYLRIGSTPIWKTFEGCANMHAVIDIFEKLGELEKLGVIAGSLLVCGAIIDIGLLCYGIVKELLTRITIRHRMVAISLDESIFPNSGLLQRVSRNIEKITGGLARAKRQSSTLEILDKYYKRTP
jgi:hypothetical protein